MPVIVRSSTVYRSRSRNRQWSCRNNLRCCWYSLYLRRWTANPATYADLPLVWSSVRKSITSLIRSAWCVLAKRLRASVVFFVLDIAEGIIWTIKIVRWSSKPVARVSSSVTNGISQRQEKEGRCHRRYPSRIAFPVLCSVTFVSAKDGTAFEKVLPLPLRFPSRLKSMFQLLVESGLHDMTARTPLPSTGKGGSKSTTQRRSKTHRQVRYFL